MSGNVRIFDSEQTAQDAAARLAEAGFNDQRVLAASQLAGREEAAVRSAREDGLLPGSAVAFSIRSLQQGRSLVAVNAPFGAAQQSINIMEAAGAVDNDKVPVLIPRNAAPLSEFLGIPTLTTFHSSTELARSSWTFSSLFGMRLLSRNPAPLSSLFRIKLLSSAKRPWNRSFGLSLLSRNPAPLSSLFRLRVLSKGPGRSFKEGYSFGYPLLSRNPAPLSSLLGIATLTKDK